MRNLKILFAGAGVMGLAAALDLLEEGHARSRSSKRRSGRAGSRARSISAVFRPRSSTTFSAAEIACTSAGSIASGSRNGFAGTLAQRLLGAFREAMALPAS